MIKLSTVDGRTACDACRCNVAGTGLLTATIGGVDSEPIDGEVGGESEGKEVRDLSELSAPVAVVEALEDGFRDLALTRAERRLDLEVVEVWDGVRLS